MKLYYAPGACSLSPHIVAREAGIALELEKVDLKAKKTASGEDFNKINPKGYVPAIRLDDGSVLTEGPAIVQYLADQKPETGLAPKNGSLERYRLQEWLNLLTSEVHKQFSPLFKPNTPEEYKKIAKENLATRFDWLDKQLAGGVLLLAGLGSRWVALGLLPVLAGAAWAHAANGWVFSAQNGGWEYPVFLIAASLVQALLGDGRLALSNRFNALPQLQGVHA